MLEPIANENSNFQVRISVPSTRSPNPGDSPCFGVKHAGRVPPEHCLDQLQRRSHTYIRNEILEARKWTGSGQAVENASLVLERRSRQALRRGRVKATGCVDDV